MKLEDIMPGYQEVLKLKTNQARSEFLTQCRVKQTQCASSTLEEK